MFVFCTSCGGQNGKTDLSKDIKSRTQDQATSPGSDELNIYTKYAYTDVVGKRLIIQNGLPRGGIKYTDPDGEIIIYAKQHH